MVTDIMRGGTELLAAGNVRLAERAFGVDMRESGSVWLEGVLSRKKQVAPKLAASLGS
jgi:manganese-dependent inorganic pyrophosphatase